MANVKVANRASVADVKAFAADNDLSAGGARGRLPKATIEAFEAATGKTYLPIDHTPRVSVSVTVAASNGRKRPQRVSFAPGDARQGDLVGKRGRVPSEVLFAHAQGLVKAQGHTLA